MSIAWSNFTPYSALLGGVLIGLAAAALMLFNGRIAGISGIVGGLFGRSASFSAGDKGWRIAFVLGLVLAPFAYRLFAVLPESQVDASWPVLIVAGLLVGFGTRYGSGCTSGHGVCGLSRFSARSLVATLLFMAAGFVTVYLLRHLLRA
ncbi:YeeE/YedE family protein [Undibacterium terreum]|uniref:Membrane protein n=1 Tax=Undibacterium terreum TaxID=1224302 RepID=A0A916V0N6_9BURK|nr:YeeE/YedE family protein [Undibacterium terreum]GGD01501.1 membrane protein [Undibacterium terreum]